MKSWSETGRRYNSLTIVHAACTIYIDHLRTLFPCRVCSKLGSFCLTIGSKGVPSTSQCIPVAWCLPQAGMRKTRLLTWRRQQVATRDESILPLNCPRCHRSVQATATRLQLSSIVHSTQCLPLSWTNFWAKPEPYTSMFTSRLL